MPAADRKILQWLALAYLAGVAVRFLIGGFAGQNPFVMPDEALYANLARSIAHGAGVALRNQPVTYTSLTYPLLISPAYLIAGEGQQFRVIQLINCIVMNLAVFPAFGIARAFTGERKTAFGIAAVSILLPDMLLTTRVMAEAVTYPLFLLTVYLMFGRLQGRRARLGWAALTGVSMFLLYGAKSGTVALAVAFAGILLAGFIRRRDTPDLKYAAVFAAVFAGLLLAQRLALAGAGMDFGWKSIYETQTQAPTAEHLKKTLPGLLLYAYFIPVAFGIYPLLLPAANLKAFDDARRRQVLLAFLALMMVAAGACYLFFDTETVGNYFAGRIHIRYVFMFLPLFMAFAASPRLEGARPNGRLYAALGFLLAMTVTVSFSALLSGRRYPVDAILLSYVLYDDPILNWQRLSQIAAVTYAAAMLALIGRRGWGRAARRVCAASVLLGLVAANALGYALNSHNNDAALSADAGEGARMLSGGVALLAPDSGMYFDNTLSVLDIAMAGAPYEALFDDLCASLGPNGALGEFAPRQYWTEKPAARIPEAARVAFNASAFTRMVPAAGADVRYTGNGYFGVVTPGPGRRLFHSALAGLPASGVPGDAAALYVFDEKALSKQTVRVYLKVKCAAAAELVLSAGTSRFRYDLNADGDWIYADFPVAAGCTALRVDIRTAGGEPAIVTYSVK